jgi:hypothetical protein
MVVYEENTITKFHSICMPQLFGRNMIDAHVVSSYVNNVAEKPPFQLHRNSGGRICKRFSTGRQAHFCLFVLSIATTQTRKGAKRNYRQIFPGPRRSLPSRGHIQIDGFRWLVLEAMEKPDDRSKS